MLADISWTNQGFSGLIGEMVSVSREEFNILRNRAFDRFVVRVFIPHIVG